MAKARILNNQYNVGEISPLMDARSDVQKYYGALKKGENVICLVQGGVRKFPGTYFIIATKYAAKDAILYDYQFSSIQSYILEIGEEYIRFYKDQGQIVNAYAAWLTGTAYVEGDLVTNSGSYYRCLEAHTSGTFATDLTAGKWVATSGATDLAYEIPSPYQESELYELKLHPVGDEIRIVHPNHPVKILTRYGHNEWTLTNEVFIFGDPRDITGITAANPVVVTSLAHGLKVGQWVRFSLIQGMHDLNDQYGKITAITTDTFTIGAINSSGYDAYVSGGIASPLEFQGTAKDITGATAANPVVITSVGHQIPNGTLVSIEGVVGMIQLNNGVYTTANATDDTFELVGINGTGYTAYTSGGTVSPPVFSVPGDYPGAIGAFEQRMGYGGTDNKPGTFWLSASAAFDMFNLTGTGDDVAIEYTLADRTDRIRWLSGQDFLMAGTDAGVWKIGASSSESPISQSNISAKRQTSFGCKNIDSELVGDSLLYVQHGGRTVRDLYYTINKPDTAGGYQAGNLTAFAEHIAKGATEALSGIIDMSYQQEPYSILWAVRADGQLLCLVYDREQNLVGWTRKVTGKTTDSPTYDTVESVSEVEETSGSTVTLTLTRTEDTAADVESWDMVRSVACIKTSAMENEVWIIVKRTVNGATVRYIEVFKPHEFFSQIKDAFFIDSGLTYDGGAEVAISGISQANPAVVTTIAHHGFVNGNKVRIYGVEGMTEANQGLTEAYTVANKTDHTFELSGISSAAWGAYTGGGYVKKVTNTFTAAHLLGRSVDILIDGARHPRKVVAASNTLSWYGNKIHVGLPYSPWVQPMNPEIQTGNGTSQGKDGRVYHLTAKFYETYGCKWGEDEDHLDEIPFGTGGTPTLFTGDIDYPFDAEVGKDLPILITQEGPFPFTLLALIPELVKY